MLLESLEKLDRLDRQSHLGVGCEMAQAARQCLFELGPLDDEIEKTVCQEKLAALKTFREILPDGLLNHSRPRKSDERAGLSDIQVAEHCKRSRDSPGSRVGQDREIGDPRLPDLRQCRRDLGELHQREDPLLHSRPT